MAIKMVPDLAAPLTTTVINIAGRTIMPQWHDWLVYGMTVAGYVGGYMNWGGDYLKQIGVSSLPLTADKLYERVRGGAVTGQRMAMRKVAGKVSQTYGPGFGKPLETY